MCVCVCVCGGGGGGYLLMFGPFGKVVSFNFIVFSDEDERSAEGASTFAAVYTCFLTITKSAPSFHCS